MKITIELSKKNIEQVNKFIDKINDHNIQGMDVDCPKLSEEETNKVRKFGLGMSILNIDESGLKFSLDIKELFISKLFDIFGDILSPLFQICNTLCGKRMKNLVDDFEEIEDEDYTKRSDDEDLINPISFDTEE